MHLNVPSPLEAPVTTDDRSSLPVFFPQHEPRSSSSSASLPGISMVLDNPTAHATVTNHTDAASQSKSHVFIDGYDNAVVHTNIHVPAEAHPVRTGRASNVATLEGIGASPLASAASFKLAAIPSPSQYSEQTGRLYERALGGNETDIKALADCANVQESENEQLRLRLRKQQHDFASLFEMVSATSARAMDVVSLQSFMLRTVAGHFATPKVMIVRRMKPDDRSFYCSASQGLKGVCFKVRSDSKLCVYAFERGASFSLKELPSPMPEAPEVEALRILGIDTVVPLLQEVDRSGAVLEGFLFIGSKLTGKPYSKHDIEFLGVLSKMFAICLRNENLYRRSIIDTLTGVSSRGHFDAQLSQELDRIADVDGKSLCLMMLDIDNFKRFNDTHGHLVGDQVLKALAKVLIAQVRDVDLVARYGGEEFAIICVEINKEVVKEVATRLMEAIRNIEIAAPDGSALRITASLGIACFPDDAHDMTTLIQLADKALYQSKDAGRDRITIVAPGSRLVAVPRRSSGRFAPQSPESGTTSNAGSEPNPHPLAPPISSTVPIALEHIQARQSQRPMLEKSASERRS